VIDKSKKVCDRYVILCDSMILVLKQLPGGKRGSVSSHAGHDYRLREKHFIRHVDVLDREDTAGESHTFELMPRDQPKLIFKAESEEEKNSWMAALVMLNTKSMLERLLDVILLKEEKKHPLRFPPVSLYRYAEPNSDANIVFETKGNSSGVPMVKGATLVKLVERLTYHLYADPMFMKTFLTTYRSFCSPHDLLDHLVERFNIPDPEVGDGDSDSDGENGGQGGGGSRMNELRQAQDLKRFRKKYSQPVQFRVVNVIKHWVDQHWHDFERDELLEEDLMRFLDGIADKQMRKWVERIKKLAQRKRICDNKEPVITLDRSPPPIEYHIDRAEDETWPELLTVRGNTCSLP